MKAIQIKEYVKGPSSLVVSTVADPQPKADEYLIRIHASAANFFDLLQIQGKYQTQPALPWVAGMEFSGVVASTPSAGAGHKFNVGDRVFGATQGAYAEMVCAREESLRAVPEGWSFAEAAGLMVTAPTSYAGLVLRARVKK
ncbi:hypothetical protein GP486_002546, partial [Trichoglossum hirsutum]